MTWSCVSSFAFCLCPRKNQFLLEALLKSGLFQKKLMFFMLPKIPVKVSKERDKMERNGASYEIQVNYSKSFSLGNQIWEVLNVSWFWSGVADTYINLMKSLLCEVVMICVLLVKDLQEFTLSAASGLHNKLLFKSRQIYTLRAI